MPRGSLGFRGSVQQEPAFRSLRHENMEELEQMAANGRAALAEARRRQRQAQRMSRLSQQHERTSTREASFSRASRFSRAYYRSRYQTSQSSMAEDSGTEYDSTRAHRHSGSDAGSLPARRASHLVRRFGSVLRGQMQGIKTSTKSGITLLLVIAIFQGTLQLAWHWLLANILALSTTYERAYALVIPPMIWYVTMIIVWSVMLVRTMRLPEDALLSVLRELLGIETTAQDTGDILADFEHVASGMQDAMDGVERMKLQVESTIANMGSMGAVARRLAENVNANRRGELNDTARREEIVATVAEVCFEFMAQLKHGAPSPGTPGGADAALAREVARLIHELKHWSTGDGPDLSAFGTGSGTGPEQEARPSDVVLRLPSVQRLRVDEDDDGSILVRPRMMSASSSFTECDGYVTSAPPNRAASSDATPQPTPRDLPDDWRAACDLNGRPFYYHKARRVTQWTHPANDSRSASPAAPPPSSPPPSPPNLLAGYQVSVYVPA
jgi:hypothetical protein